MYLGAPCAVPIDPRHRLLSSKYNPARTFTAEGTVGIGGMYMCIYGMDSPGGYQLVGRTLPIWNKIPEKTTSSTAANRAAALLRPGAFLPGQRSGAGPAA
ncbi:Allophanate hydrolase subunit 2 [Kluyvera cryocrescens]|uniref:Allophanate hydrolase subunit 2 n=1 Tax=Kluyvera cryocrescens TaxID=580 RepID=A0A485D2D0_KLUCR|nr:Allophanate hydrolase subunit 2 [Kluyvera cryocrescens]